MGRRLAAYEDETALRRRNELFSRAVEALVAARAAQAGDRKGPGLYDARGNALTPTGSYQYRRQAAKREGSLQNWIPRRIYGRHAETLERERIMERSIDLVNNDPHAAGVVDTFATTVVGAGQEPRPYRGTAGQGIETEEGRRVQGEKGLVYDRWSPHADAAGRMTAGGLQFLIQRNLIQFGEYLVTLPMLRESRPLRPYSLGVQVIHPMRLKTPTDKQSDGNIRDGVELGRYGRPVAYWIKRADTRNPNRYLSDKSKNFIRLPARRGHRWVVLHGFIQHDPEQVRGMPFFAPAMKFFRDLNDYLDAELVANVVTAAYALFIESADVDPLTMAGQMAYDDNAGSGKDLIRYEEVIPGSVMYGEPGQKPHPISANRPGTTFPVFVKEIKKAMAQALNMPYAALFKDVEDTNYAGFRSAMLDAWRVFSHRRAWLGESYGRRVRNMLLEEAWLRGDLPGIGEDFYERMDLWTACEWIGPPKGNIEPVKEIQADILAVKNNLKTRARAISEQGGEWRAVFEQLEEEKSELESRDLPTGLDEGPQETDEEREEE